MNDLLENWNPEYLEDLKEEHNIDLTNKKCSGLSKQLQLSGSPKKTQWWVDRGWTEAQALKKSYDYRVKKGPNKKECIEYLEDKAFRDLHPEKKHELIEELIIPENMQYGKVWLNKLILKECQFPESGKDTRVYWISRGWSIVETELAFRSNKKYNPVKSPMAIEHWLKKGYTHEQAEYLANETKPTRVEYWMKQGYSLLEAEEKVSEHQSNVSKKRK